jgi:hypothetical protein
VIEADDVTGVERPAHAACPPVITLLTQGIPPIKTSALS